MLDLNNPEQRLSFSGLNVLISGGTTGIGRAIALKMLASGANVFVFGRHQQELDDTLAEAKGGALRGITADQSDAGEVEKAFQEFDRFQPHLDILINNAALGSEDLMEETDSNIDYIVRSNVCGYLYCTRQAVSRMVKNEVIVLFYEKLQPIQTALQELDAQPVVALPPPVKQESPLRRLRPAVNRTRRFGKRLVPAMPPA